MSQSYQLRVHPRARHVRLRLDPREGLIVTVPPRFDQRRIPALLEQRRDWIQTVKHRQAAERAAADPTLLGRRPRRIELAAIGRAWDVDYRASTDQRQRLRCAEGRLVLELPPAPDEVLDELIALLLRRWLARQARVFLVDELARLAKRHGLRYRDVSIRHQRTRWGSCSGQGRISLNARLMFCTPDLCEYVLIHELVHTEHPDHSKRFWSRVGELCPNYLGARNALSQVWQQLPDWA